jgi:hypothetical protein
VGQRVVAKEEPKQYPCLRTGVVRVGLHSIDNRGATENSWMQDGKAEVRGNAMKEGRFVSENLGFGLR